MAMPDLIIFDVHAAYLVFRSVYLRPSACTIFRGNWRGTFFVKVFFTLIYQHNIYKLCVDMYKATHNQGQATHARGLTKIIVGALLLGIGEFLGSGSATLFGSDQTSGLGELGL